jgi:hypothetical protein
MRFGAYTPAVDNLLRWIDGGALLQFGTPLSGPFIPVSDFEEALAIAQGRTGSVDWTEVRENADASLYEVGLLDTQAWLPYKEGINSLLSQVADRVDAVLPKDYLPILDDVIADLHTCSVCLAIRGSLDPFHERLWRAYACGGWPCGCTGEKPKPPDYDLDLGARKFYVLWKEKEQYRRSGK